MKAEGGLSQAPRFGVLSLCLFCEMLASQFASGDTSVGFGTRSNVSRLRHFACQDRRDVVA